MLYKIVYDKNTRLRVRAGKYAFTKEEGYGLSELLCEYDFIDEVTTSHKNGSILIKYNDIKKRNDILLILKSITKNDLREGKPSDKEVLKTLANKFFIKLSKKILKRYLLKVVLPIPLRRLRILYKSVPFIIDGMNSLLNFRADVDLLDASALSGSLYKRDFNSADSMMFLLSISDLLEEYTMQKTRGTLKNSLAINVDNIWLVTEDENGELVETVYPLSKVKKGDKIRLRMGAMIPIDGTIIEGEGMINEASMTGEPLAVRKTVGRTVHAGTIIEEGSIIVETSSVNEDTRLNNIVSMIEESEELKAGIQSKAESLADSIVPYSFLTTALTYLFTRDSTKALSVLMVDFSCAIKLATPISIISAMREASDNRMMIKGGKFLEQYAKADTIVFDKTGTLTNASPRLAKVIPCGKYSRDEVLRISACIEEHFAHSVATAIVKQAEKEGLHHEEDHSDVEYIVAHGISTYYGDEKAIIGSYHFIAEDEGIEFTDEQKKLVKESIDEYSVIYLAIGGKLEGLLCIDDPVRKEAKEVINQLRDLGISNVVMLTGDSENAAKTIAKNLDITDYKYEVLPEDKEKYIKELKNNGHTVIMVGDGINDSPALSAADVSVAMRDSSDIAREVADISLLSDDLYDLITLRKLSTGLLDKINKNYNHIVLINGTLIGLGVFGIIPPSTSSLVHNLSTMLIGATSTRSILKDNKNKIIDVKVENGNVVNS